MTSNVLAYATWPSPVDSKALTSDSVAVDEVRLSDGTIYWIEKRPSEKGRCVIVAWNDGAVFDVLPAPYSARSRVHEYGGGVYCVADNGLYFVNDSDQDIYHLDTVSNIDAVIRNTDTCYADLQFDPHRGLIFCISQQHADHDTEASNRLVAVEPATGKQYTLHSGHDFYSNPRLSHDGKKICWLCWDHPNMPWDHTRLCTADIEWRQDGKVSLANIEEIDHGCDMPVSLFQPEWSADGILHFVSDLNGWWNLYRYHNNGIEQLTDEQQEFGRPQWVFAQSAYAFIDATRLVCAPVEQGITQLAILDTEDRTLTPVKSAWSSIDSLQGANQSCCFIAASESSFPAVIHYDLQQQSFTTIRSSCNTDIDSNYFSHGQIIKFKTRHHDDVYAIYYPPHNIDVVADIDEKPPLIILTHGGPTAMSDPSLDLRKQYWTTRGFAILDVNYSGSTGFGRAYRNRLDESWGIRDAEDCCDAALHMVSMGLADADRLLIKGSSAGGYTVLCALTFHDVFAAGASYYGIGDLESLLNDTHKFESRYLDRLVGAYPEQQLRYRERAPLHHVEQLNCPVIFFQGTEDKVVPMQQAEAMVSALKKRAIPVACIYFEGEQHGFRKAETIETAIDSEYAFYLKLFGLDVTGTVAVRIENLEP